jgi:hypothetical protein
LVVEEEFEQSKFNEEFADLSNESASGGLVTSRSIKETSPSQPARLASRPKTESGSSELRAASAIKIHADMISLAASVGSVKEGGFEASNTLSLLELTFATLLLLLLLLPLAITPLPLLTC